MLDFYKEHYTPDEVVCSSLNVKWDEALKDLLMTYLQQDLSIGLISSKSEEIIGGRMTIINKKAINKIEIDTGEIMSDAWRKFVDFMYHSESLCNVYDHYNVEEVVHFFKLAVHKNFRGKSIAMKLMKAAIAFIRNLDIGPLVIRGEGSSNFSQRIYEKLGFDVLAEVVYADYMVDGEVVVKNTGEHKSEKVYGMII